MMALEWHSIQKVARREARLGTSSKAVWGVLGIVIVGTVALVAVVAGNLTEADQQVVEQSGANPPIQGIGPFILANFFTVTMGMTILMNSTMVGGSIAEEKDKKVIEILLSMVRPDSLYLGKIFGHFVVSLIQLVLIWIAVIASVIVFDVVSLSDLPIGFCFAILGLMVQAYLFFTALYGLAGSFVSNNETFAIAQIPIVLLFTVCLAVPILPVFGWGSLTDGWVPMLSWISPLSMAVAPIVDSMSGGLWIRTAVSMMGFCVEILLLIWVGKSVFRRKVLS